MPHHVLKRAFAALVLLWFVVVTTEPPALHLCPVHGPLAAAAAPAAHHVDGHSHSTSVPGGQHSQCTCVGDCSAGSFSVALSSAEVVLTAGTPRESENPRPEAQRPRVLAVAFLLPYANGPPGIPVLA